MKIGIFFAKIMALVLSTVLFTSNVTSNNVDVAENSMQSSSVVETEVLSSASIMEIECPHCHEHFFADINKNHADCPYCGYSSSFAG